MISAIPTKYKGRLYRSKLEAKWAAMFDQLGWNFEYEPFETNGWIPDFLLIGKTQKILVEVKPFSTLEEFEQKMIPKIEKGLWGHPYFGTDILLLGVRPLASTAQFSLGFLGEFIFSDNQIYAFGEAVVTHLDNHYGLAHEFMSFKDRITDFYDGNLWGIPEPHGTWKWNLSCNEVQWQPDKEPPTKSDPAKEQINRMLMGEIPMDREVIQRWADMRRGLAS